MSGWDDDEDDVEAELHHHFVSDTRDAYRVSTDGDEDSAFWLPKSQAHRGRRTGRADPVYIFTMPQWLADDKDLT